MLTGFQTVLIKKKKFLNRLPFTSYSTSPCKCIGCLWQHLKDHLPVMRDTIRVLIVTRYEFSKPCLRPDISGRTMRWNFDFEGYGIERSWNVLPGLSGRSCSERTCFYRGEILDLCPPSSGFRAKWKRTRDVVPGISPPFGRREGHKRKKSVRYFPSERGQRILTVTGRTERNLDRATRFMRLQSVY